MTAQTTAQADGSAYLRSRDFRSLALAMLVLAIALALGWLLRSWVVDRTDTVSLGGATSQVPADWPVEPGGGELAFSAADPSDVATRYSVWALEETDLDLESTARDFVDQALISNAGLQITNEGPVSIDGRDGYEVRYAFLDPVGPRMINGIAWVTASSGATLVVTLESPSERFEQNVPRFYSLADSAETNP